MNDEYTLCFDNEDPIATGAPAVDASINPLKSSHHHSINLSKEYGIKTSTSRLPPNPYNNRLRT